MLTFQLSRLRRGWWRLAPAGLMVLTIACGRDRARDSSSPAGELIEEVPPPAPTLSRFDVPLEYDFTPILRQVERAVPHTLGSLESLHQLGDDRRRLYAYEVTRGPFTTFMVGTEVHLRTTLSYAVRGYYNMRPLFPVVRVGALGGCAP